MATLTISLSESQKAFIEAQVIAGGFASASEFIGRLIHQAEMKKEREHIDALLLEGLNSGESTPMTAQDWDDIRQEILEGLAKAKPTQKQK
jgi:antitoxin ParD1/3/4